MKIHLAQSIPLTAAVLLSSLAPAIAAVQFIPPPPPDQGYPPGSLRGGASRGDCPQVATPLTALAPPAGWGLTIRDRPTFWFYVPYSLTDDRPGEFVLLDADRNYVYQTSNIRSAGAGIIQITLPPSVPPLAIGQRYQWTLMIGCESDNPIFTQGSIERIAPPADLSDRLARSTPLEQADLLANQGIWYDALTTLAELHIADPTDRTIAANWYTLMQSVGLSDLADQPLLDCCAID